MKKILVLICAVMFLFTAVGPVWAEESSNSSNVIEVKFKVGDSILKINGKDVEVQKPYAVNGTTLVPLRVITEAFGADLEYNPADKSIIIKYADVSIKLVIGSKEATINNQKVTMLEAPAAKNGTTMVPLRFITENFGAEVKFDDKTKEIIVLKEIASDTSIKDFSLILTVTNKEIMGDSYYGWSINKPKNLKIAYRSFNGRSNVFNDHDGVYSIRLYIYEAGDDTLDSLLAEEIEYVSDYTILSQSIETAKDGQQYAKVVYKDSESTYEDRIYVKNDRAYYLELTVEESAKYKNNTEIQNLMNSFVPSFEKNGKIEDLSDVNLTGFRTYSNKKLKWSVNVPAEWNDYKSEDKDHEVSFADAKAGYGVDSIYFDVNMYSKEEGLTLDTWVESKKKELTEEYNSNLVKVVSEENIKLNNVAAKKLVLSTQYKKTTVYQCLYYIIGENYRYVLSYTMGAEKYKNHAEQTKLETMAYSFKFTEPKADDVGTLLDPSKIAVSNTTRKVESKDYKWSTQIPSSWILDSPSSSKEEVSYVNKDDTIGLTINIYKDKTISEYAKNYEAAIRVLEEEGSLTVEKMETVNEKGKTIKKYIYVLSEAEEVYKFTNYLFEKDGNAVLVTCVIDDIRASEKNVKVLSDIWQSFEIQ